MAGRPQPCKRTRYLYRGRVSGRYGPGPRVRAACSHVHMHERARTRTLDRADGIMDVIYKVHAATDRNISIVNFDPSPYIPIVFIIIRNNWSYNNIIMRATVLHSVIRVLTIVIIVNSYIFSLLLLCCCGCCLPSEQRRQHHSPSGCVSTPTQLLQRKKSEGLQS